MAYGYDSNRGLVLLLAMFCLHNESIRAWRMFCERLCLVYNFERDDGESDEGGGDGGGADAETGGAQHPHRIDSAEKVMITDGSPAIRAMFDGDDVEFTEMHQALCEFFPPSPAYY